MTLKLGIVAGELSGDRLAGDLVRALQQHDEVQCVGVGGPDLAAEGLESIVPLERFSMHGFAEPIRQLPFLWQSLKRIETRLLDEQVDVFVGVDFNVFNLLLERRLRRRGVPVVHYVSPSVYAWRRGRTRRVAQSADVLLTLFPFEPPLYEGQPVRAVFVGHPLADQIPPQAPEPLVHPDGSVSPGVIHQKNIERAAPFVPEGERTVTLMPGSRESEIEHLLTPFLDAALVASRAQPALRYIIPCATPRIHQRVQETLQRPPYGALAVTLQQGDARSALAVSDGALIKSGTSTLEAMLLGVPMVVAYRLPVLTYQIVRRMLRTEFIALPNILAGEALVPELLQDEMQPEALAEALLAQLQPSKRAHLQQRFLKVHTQLRCGASRNAAAEVWQLARARRAATR